LVWGGAVFAFPVSYRAMIVLCWLTHALNVFLLGRLLDRCGFGRDAIALALLVFGLAYTNVETLGWSVQLASVLAWFFFFIAALVAFELADTWSWPRLMLLVMAVTASGLSLSRGVLTGVSLAALCLVPGGLR